MYGKMDGKMDKKDKFKMLLEKKKKGKKDDKKMDPKEKFKMMIAKKKKGKK